MDIFYMAQIQLKREGLLNKPNRTINLIDRAVRIRKWLDLQEKNIKISNTLKHKNLQK